MAGYIGKSLATGGTAVDAYSKTQTDEKYLKLTGGLMTGGVRQGVLSVSDDTTITASHPNVILVTTGTDSITLTLPSAGDVGGQVYRFMKVDTGTGKVILARAGSDTMGINANLTMELWFQDNYVDLMSDGTSRWIVVGTETFKVPDANRDTNNITGLSGTTTLNVFTAVSLANYTPVGTLLFAYYGHLYTTTGTNQCSVLFRPYGGVTGDFQKQIQFFIQADANGEDHALSNQDTIEVGYNSGVPTIEYNMAGAGSSLTMHQRGYRLG